MCYSGQCNYENSMGDCTIIGKETPNDAACVQAEAKIYGHKSDDSNNGDVKQVIIIRKDLNMSAGKVAAQASHASLKSLTCHSRIVMGAESHFMVTEVKRPMQIWLNGIYKKVVLSVNSEEQLKEIYNTALDKGIACSLIRDIGLTQFNGILTYTACAIGPWWSEEIDKITRHLKLL